MTVVLLSGALAGFVLFVAQHLAVVPLIETAETYESAARQAMPGMAHEDEGWQPADGLERTSFTALSTMLAGIGFAAVLFGAASLSGRALDLRRGVLWGLAGFACFALAPALGLPPKPPGAGQFLPGTSASSRAKMTPGSLAYFAAASSPASAAGKTAK